MMLVDVLGALYAGQAAFEDTARAIHDLATGLRDGWGFWSRKRRQSAADSMGQYGGLASGRIAAQGFWAAAAPVAVTAIAMAAVIAPHAVERVAFVATKADHVPGLSRANLRDLLEALARRAGKTWAQSSATVSYHVAASVRPTEDGTAEIGDRTVEVVKGVILGENKVRPFYVGQVPSDIPPAGFWTAPFFEMPVFRPPIFDASGLTGIPHLGLDEVLDAVIGDLL